MRPCARRVGVEDRLPGMLRREGVGSEGLFGLGMRLPKAVIFEK